MDSSLVYDVLIVGGGMAGLTAAAYLSKAGLKVLLCEKEKKTGGLVNSFDYKGFVFDGGIRGIENSGIVPTRNYWGNTFPKIRRILPELSRKSAKLWGTWIFFMALIIRCLWI
jgi:phytoene dehydrogenase-like protein